MKALILTAVVTGSGLASAQTSFFNLSNATISGTPNAVNSLYTYVRADPGGLYDVVVTVIAQSANSAIFSNPQIDATTGFTDGSNFPAAAPFLTPSWNLNDSTTVASYIASMTFQVSVFRTGTSNAAPLNLYATTYDNDGSTVSGAADVFERVAYSGTPSYLSIGSGQTRSRNQFTASTTGNGAGVSTDPVYRIQALYNNASTFNWTSSHLANDLAPDGGNNIRISGLELGFTPVPEPTVTIFALITVSILALRRRRW